MLNIQRVRISIYALALLWASSTLTALASPAHSIPNFGPAPYTEFTRVNFSDLTADQTNVGSITIMKQDHKGFLWVGGENGLARYDGHSVLLYRASADPNSLPADYIQAIEIDENKQHLWFATTGGVSRFNLNTGDFDNITSADDRIASNDVAALAQYKSWIIVGTTEGLALFNKQTLEPHRPVFLNKLPAKIHVRHTYVERDTLWIGTSHLGLIAIDLITQEVTFYSPDANNPDAIPHKDIRGIITLDGDNYWLASLGGGLIHFHPKSGKFVQYAKNNSADESFVTNDVWGVYGDSRGYLWIGTDKDGLWRLAPNSREFQGYEHNQSVTTSIDSDKARVFFEDSHRNIWIGSFSGILNFNNRQLEQFTLYRKANALHQGLSEMAILSILPADDGRFWIGTEGGLDLLDIEQGSQQSYTTKNSPLLAPPILDIEPGRQGNLWLATWGGGLQRFNPETQEWLSLIEISSASLHLPARYIWALQRDKRGNLWVGTQKAGTYKIHLESETITHYPYNAIQEGALVGEFVWDITLDQQGDVWIGSLHGLSRYRPETDDFEVFRNDKDNPNSLGSNQIVSILAHSNGELWLGSRNAGMTVFNPKTQQYRRFGLKEGLPATYLVGLTEDSKGNVWAGTSVGLVRLTPDLSHLEVYKEVHGLAGSGYNRNAIYYDSEHGLLAGSTTGLSIFKPAALGVNLVHSNTVISGLSVNYGALHGTEYWQAHNQETLDLNYDENAIHLEFSLNQFHYPKLNEYAFRLRGLSDSWKTIRLNNTATYTNLDPGLYTFEVKGRAAHGQWGQNVTEVSFEITAPPWRSVWAYIIYALLVGSIIAAYRNYTAVKARAHAYRQLSLEDPLTKLPNRLALNNRVDELLLADRLFSIVVIDLDHFKQVNDNYGHEIGDLILQEFAAAARDCLGGQDMMGRWGGEEFLILCDELGADAAEALATDIQQTVAQRKLVSNQRVVKFTISAGVALRKPDESFSNLFHRADAALYNAKAGGRNCVRRA